jgi:hypothetical protein
VLGYAIGPIAGIMLWTEIGKSFWGICLVFGLVMTVAGIWGMRPTGRPTGRQDHERTATATTVAEPATELRGSDEHRTRQR